MTIDNIESERGSVRDVREYLCPPQVIKDLEIGQCIMITKSPSSLHFVKLRDVRKSDAFGYNKNNSQDITLKKLINDNPILRSTIETTKDTKHDVSRPTSGLEHFYKEESVNE
jgi:hypothetical protein